MDLEARLAPKIRTAITLGALVALLLLGLVWGWTQVTRPFPTLSGKANGGEPLCVDTPVKQGDTVKPDQVTVSVYNAGTTEGLASKTMVELMDRGFARGDMDNVVLDKPVDKAQIWSSDPANPAVELVRGQFSRKVDVVAPKDEIGSGVIVIVGDHFKGLHTGGKMSVKASADAEICSPTKKTKKATGGGG